MMMLYKYGWIAMMVLVLTGCGGGGGGSSTLFDSNDSNGSADINNSDKPIPAEGEAMVYGERYVLGHGDSIVRVTEDAQVLITHHLYDENATVELAAGKANIIRKP
jgi:hypothetical protein